jgi:outer membrane lipoprotein-sorting protein
MKTILQLSVLGLLSAALALGQNTTPPATSPSPESGSSPSAAAPASGTKQSTAPSHAGQQAAGPQDLKGVLEEMNKAAATFKSAQADFEWDQYQKVVEEHDLQKGQIYFRRTRSGKDIDAAVNVTSPDRKQVVFIDGKLSLYQPKIDQVTEYKASSNRADVESFVSLGFGASGDDLARNFELKLDGWETVDGVRTAKLDMIPKKEKMKASINRVLLWIDPQRNVSLKQQFFEPSGDYRLTHYTNIKLNGRVSDNVFRLKTTSKTKFVQPQ